MIHRYAMNMVGGGKNVHANLFSCSSFVELSRDILLTYTSIILQSLNHLAIFLPIHTAQVTQVPASIYEFPITVDLGFQLVYTLSTCLLIYLSHSLTPSLSPTITNTSNLIMGQYI